MPTQEILPEEWVTFLDGFSGRHEDWLVTVERIGMDVGAQVEAEELPLSGVSADLKDKEAVVSIILSKTPQQHVTYTLPAVSHVRLKQNDVGADEALQIEAADRTMLLLRFRTPVLPETVDGFIQD